MEAINCSTFDPVEQLFWEFALQGRPDESGKHRGDKARLRGIFYLFRRQVSELIELLLKLSHKKNHQCRHNVSIQLKVVLLATVQHFLNIGHNKYGKYVLH